MVHSPEGHLVRDEDVVERVHAGEQVGDTQHDQHVALVEAEGSQLGQRRLERVGGGRAGVVLLGLGAAGARSGGPRHVAPSTVAARRGASCAAARDNAGDTSRADAGAGARDCLRARFTAGRAPSSTACLLLLVNGRFTFEALLLCKM